MSQHNKRKKTQLAMLREEQATTFARVEMLLRDTVLTPRGLNTNPWLP
jgi:hypothetical protein